MRIALATTRELPRPDTDLSILVDACAARNVRAECVAWDDPRISWEGFDVVVVRSTWNYVAHYEAFLRWIDFVAARTTLVNPAAILRWNLHKRYLLELAAAGIPVVPTELVPRGVHPDWPELFARHDELVVKPAVSAGSLATIRVSTGDTARAHAHRETEISRDMLVQPLLHTVVKHGESNLVFLGGDFSHAIRKGARWDGDSEQSRGLVEPDTDELELARRIVAWVAAQGHGTPAYARVDLARDGAGNAVLMELEVVEPSLFLDRAPAQAAMLVDAVLRMRA